MKFICGRYHKDKKNSLMDYTNDLCEENKKMLQLTEVYKKEINILQTHLIKSRDDAEKLKKIVKNRDDEIKIITDENKVLMEDKKKLNHKVAELEIKLKKYETIHNEGSFRLDLIGL